MAFMTLRPFAPGECLVIPRRHVDHFTDLDDGTATRIIEEQEAVIEALERRRMELLERLGHDWASAPALTDVGEDPTDRRAPSSQPPPQRG